MRKISRFINTKNFLVSKAMSFRADLHRIFLHLVIIFHILEASTGMKSTSTMFVSSLHQKIELVPKVFMPSHTNKRTMIINIFGLRSARCVQFCGDRQVANCRSTNTTKPTEDVVELKLRKGSPQLPHHIAIIMDGNRRFAKSVHMPAEYGHYMGKETLERVVRWVPSA